MPVCPTCGGQVKVSAVIGADELMDILAKDPDRFIYRGCDGGWFLTKRRGELNSEIVWDLIRRGAIRSRYSDCPNEAYHAGKTIDITLSLAARKKFGKGAPLVYIDLQQTPGV